MKLQDPNVVVKTKKLQIKQLGQREFGFLFSYSVLTQVEKYTFWESAALLGLLTLNPTFKRNYVG